MRYEFAERVRQAVSEKDDGSVYGIGDDFRPDGDPEEAFLGWYYWRMSDRQRMPTREEIRTLDHEWMSDVFWVENIARWITNTSGFFGMLKDRPNGGEIDVVLVPETPPTPTAPPQTSV